LPVCIGADHALLPQGASQGAPAVEPPGVEPAQVPTSPALMGGGWDLLAQAGTPAEAQERTRAFPSPVASLRSMARPRVCQQCWPQPRSTPADHGGRKAARYPDSGDGRRRGISALDGAAHPFPDGI